MYLTMLVLIQFTGSLLCVANRVLATKNDEDTQLQVVIKLKVNGSRLEPRSELLPVATPLAFTDSKQRAIRYTRYRQ